MTIREILTEGMRSTAWPRAPRSATSAPANCWSGWVAARCADRYPHEFSGGQRQRIAIARALSVDPLHRLRRADQRAGRLGPGQVLNLLAACSASEGLTYLFITHNLGVVEYMADEVCVMEKAGSSSAAASSRSSTNLKTPTLAGSWPQSPPWIQTGRGW